MPVGYESPESFIFRDLGKDKVACPRCGNPMNYKNDLPIFCNSCDWPEKWKEKKGNGSNNTTMGD